MAADAPTPSSPSDRRPTGGEEDDAWRPEWDPQRLTRSGADTAIAPLGASGRSARSWAGIASGVLVLGLVVAAAVLLVDRGNDGPSTGGGPSTGVPPSTSGPATSSAGAADPTALAAARRVFEQVNAEAGAAPARQRSVLERVVDPAQRTNQRECAAAVTTVRLIPAWSQVRRAPDGHLIVPSLVRIFTGTRITGTDVAIIDVTISAGQAGLPALCVS